jgi:phenylacetate-CoA ligase
MGKFIAKHIAYPLQDFYNKTSILPTLTWLMQTQNWSESQMMEYQFSKFKNLIEHANRNVPYYSNLFSTIKLKPSDIKSFDDLHKIPVLTKETARKENRNLIASNLTQRHVHKGVTGGTTGPPLKLLRDAGDLTFTWAAFYRWYSWMGIEMGDRVSKIWGTRTVLSMPLHKRKVNWIKNRYYNRNFINSFNLNDRTIPNVILSLNRFKPKLIRGYLSAFIQIAEYMRDNHLSLDFRPVALSSTTETLMEPYRKLVEQQLGARLYDQYGCGECNSIAFEAGDGLGLYTAPEHVKLEILNDSGVSVVNKEGRIILTNLDNYIMPFIRYDNGDSGALRDESLSKKYNFPILKFVSGRSADTITLANGSKVHGVFFTDIMNELFTKNPEDLHRFQVYQPNAGEIEFRIESKKNIAEPYLKSIEEALYRFFNKVTITVTSELPADASGKFRYVMSR